MPDLTDNRLGLHPMVYRVCFKFNTVNNSTPSAENKNKCVLEDTRSKAMNEGTFIKEVAIDQLFNGDRYRGTVTVRAVNGEVESFVYHGFEVLDTEYARYDGYGLGRITRLIRNEAMYKAGLTEGLERCDETGYYFSEGEMVSLDNGDRCVAELAYWFEDWDCYVLRRDCGSHQVRRGFHDYEDLYCPDSYLNDYYYWCEECNSYVHMDDWDSEYEGCRWCAEEHEEPSVIEGYSESHRHTPTFFGEFKSVRDFAGIGFELEVDCKAENSYKNEDTALNLCEESELEDGEMRFAHDGSLFYGFECISQPHTVKDFWDKQKKWDKMLKYLASRGYRSHDTCTCGLHVHVSRNMFGSDKATQDVAIAKVYTFFDENWDDLVRVSRRRNFDYCDKNKLNWDDYAEVSKGRTTKLKKWRHKSKYESGHYVALNNGNSTTFEYRLGRGTLNPWSFFSWIDLVVTITKNARRITIEKVNSNDLVSWLGGIKETTARYIYKRGAFRDTMITLFPSIEWELSTVDNTDNADDE